MFGDTTLHIRCTNGVNVEDGLTKARQPLGNTYAGTFFYEKMKEMYAGRIAEDVKGYEKALKQHVLLVKL